MDSKHDKKRFNVEGDRLSSLPDDLIHKILSFISLKRSIETSSFSSRWRYVWTSMPYLTFSSEDFSTLPEFSKFVTEVLSRHNNLAEVFSVEIRICGNVSEEFVKQIMNNILSQNIQLLDVKFLLANHLELPLSLFSSKSLKHLSLKKEIGFWGPNRKPCFAYSLKLTSTWELPALTTLYLDDVSFCVDNTDKCIGLFSKCANLKNLTLKNYNMVRLNSLNICHPRLSNLTLENAFGGVDVVVVDAPLLENLAIRNWSWWLPHLISAPNLASLLYDGSRPLRLYTDGFNSLEKADLCVSSSDNADAHKIVCLLKQLRSIKFLKLSLEMVELLSSSVELITDQPSPFTNLKMLKIYPEHIDLEKQEHNKVNMTMEVINCLLNKSPTATFTMVSREEIRAKRNTKLAHTLIRVTLAHEKAKTETNMTHSHMHEQREAQLENQLEVEERMTQINSCWEDLSRQIEHWKAKTCYIVSKLQDIEDVLTKLPEAKRSELQPCFSGLCAEADTVVKKIMNYMKIQCDMGKPFQCPF